MQDSFVVDLDRERTCRVGESIEVQTGNYRRRSDQRVDKRDERMNVGGLIWSNLAKDYHI